MAKQSVKIDGVEYESRTAAAKAIVATGKSLKETVDILKANGCEVSYQTVYANTIGLDKVTARRAHYRILSLGQKGRRTVGEIAKKVNMSTSKVIALLKKNGIAIVTKEAQAAAKAAAKPARKQKITQPENVITVPEPQATDTETPVAPEAAVASSTAETPAVSA